MYTLTHSEPFLLSQAAIQLAFILVLVAPALLMAGWLAMSHTSKAVTCEGASVDTVKLGWLAKLKRSLCARSHGMPEQSSTCIVPVGLSKIQSQYLSTLGAYNTIVAIWTTDNYTLHAVVHHKHTGRHSFGVEFLCGVVNKGEPDTRVYCSSDKCVKAFTVRHNTIDAAFNELLSRWDASVELELQK